MRKAAKRAAPAAVTADRVVPAGLVADANTDGAGTDNAYAIQAAIDTGLPVALPPGRYAVASTLRLNPAVGLSLGGTFGGRLGPDSPGNGTWLVWTGAPGGTLIDLRGIKCRLHDVGILADRTTTLGRAVAVESPDTYPNLSSQHLFENVTVDGRWGPVRCGWVVGEDGKPNNEFHWWKSCLTRYCTYAGVHVPNGTFQAKNNVCEDCTFGGSGKFDDYGVAVASGSFSFWRCNWDSCGYACKWWGGSYEPVQFLNCTGESNRHFLAAAGCQHVILDGCRLALNKADSPQVVGDEFLSGGANWSVRCCTVEDPDGLDGWFRPQDSGTVCIDGLQCHSARPLSADGLTTWKGSFRNFRVDQGNNMVPNGVWYQRNGLTASFLGPNVVLGDGSWPPRGKFNGGTYYPAAGEARMRWEGGKLLIQTYDGTAWATRQVQTAPLP